MSVFAQNTDSMDSAVYQSFVAEGSPFYKEILNPVSANLRGSYDGQTLDIWCKSGMGSYVISINEQNNLFRSYLPSLTSIQSQHVHLKVYQADLDGKNMLVSVPAFTFYGKSLTNIRIRTSKSVSDSWIDASFLENVDFDSAFLRFVSAMGHINHKFGLNLPEAGQNVNIPKMCAIHLESRHERDVLIGLRELIDDRGFSRLQKLDSCSTWGDFIEAACVEPTGPVALPLLRGIRINKFLDLPKYLRNKYMYVMSFSGGTDKRIYFMKYPDGITGFAKCAADKTYASGVNYVTDDGYYVCIY